MATVISTIIGLSIVVVLYILGYYIMFKAKTDKGCLVGLLVIFAAVGMSMITISVGRALREDDSPKQEDNSQVETRDELIVKIPYNFDGGFLITEDGEHRVYVGGIDNIKETLEEDIKEEK